MKMTIDTPENPKSNTMIFEVPTGLWRFTEHRLNDGRCLTNIVFIHGEKEDIEFDQCLPSAEKAERDINYGVSGCIKCGNPVVGDQVPSKLPPKLNQGNTTWGRDTCDIKFLTFTQAIQKRPYLYVGDPEDNNGLNVVKEAIAYATNVVSRGGEAFIRYGDGSKNSSFIVRTFEEIQDIDLEKMFALYCGKLEDNEYYRFGQLGVALALCKEFQVIHFTKERQATYNFSSGYKKSSFKHPNYDGDLPGVQFRMTLDLNVVDRVPFQALIEYLAKNPWFHWSIEMSNCRINDDVDEFIIFRGLPTTGPTATPPTHGNSTDKDNDAKTRY